MLPLSPTHHHDLRDAVHTSPTGETRTKPEARHRLRDQLFGTSSHHSSETLSQTQGLNTAAPLHVRGSSMDNPKIDMPAAIALLRELQKTATPEDLVALHRALLPTVDSTSSKLVETPYRVEPANASLIRRKSLFTPGVATRIEYATNLARSKTTKASRKSQDAAQQPADFYSILKPEIGVATTARVITPSELSYTQLGMHEPGSLRVINVTPMISQRPSLEDLGQPGSLVHPEEKNSPPPAILSKTQQNPAHVEEHEELGQDHASANGVSIDGPEIQVSAPEPTSPAASVRKLPGGPRKPLFTRHKTNDSTASGARISSLQKMYSFEASSNPFSSSPDLVHAQAAGSTSVAELTNGTVGDPHVTPRSPMLVDDDDTSVYSAYTRPADCSVSISGGFATFAYEDLLSASQIQAANEKAVLSSESQLSRLPVDDVPVGNPDGGYGSDTSSRGHVKGLASRSTNREHLIAAGMTDTSVDSSSLLHPHGDAPTAERSLDFDSRLPSPNSGRKPNCMLGSAASPTRSSPATSSRSHAKGSSVSIDKPSNSTEDTQSPKVNIPKKLQKKRPASVPPPLCPIAQPAGTEILEIPLVPHDMALRHARRLTMNPGMEHLERTVDSAVTSDGQDRSSTPVAQFDRTFKFPSPSPSSEPGLLGDRGRKSRRQSKERRRSQAGGFFRSKSRKRDESRDSITLAGGGNDVGCNLADFGIVARSLGDGPYAAASIGGPESRRYPAGPLAYAHPHQISHLPRGKSVTGMDEKAASELALLRSRDRNGNMDAKPSSSGYRNKSKLSSPKLDDGVQWPGRHTRRRGSVTDVPPPVPALPSLTIGVPRVRPKSVHASSFTRAEEDTLASDGDLSAETTAPEQRHSYIAPTSTNTADVEQSEVITPKVISKSEIDDAWSEQASAWRIRRKAVGEGLRGGAYDGNSSSKVVSPPYGIQPCAPPAYYNQYVAVKTADAPAFPPRNGLRPTQSVRLANSARPPSPAPSILARAALFERAANIGGPAPMPPPFPGTHKAEKPSAVSGLGVTGIVGRGRGAGFGRNA